MSALHHSTQQQVKSRLVPLRANRRIKKDDEVRLRICLFVPFWHQQELIINQLTVEHGVAVRILTPVPTALDYIALNATHQLHLELVGSIAQIHNVLDYLTSINLTVRGKPNPDGDSWHY